MKHPRFELSYFLGSNDVFHIARVNVTSREDLSYHCHNYVELLWVESGDGYHYINGNKIKISEGDLIMMRPDDIHTFNPGRKGLTIMNIAFAKSTLDYYKQRYFQNSTMYFWSGSQMPYQMKIPKHVQNRLSARAEETIRYSRSNLQLDSLLLFIFRLITDNEMGINLLDIPLWLMSALKQYNNPEVFQQGVQGFVNLCERNLSHINRTIRMYFGKTMTELLNEHKMNYAVVQLSLTDMPIKEICNNCGFNNIGHFYKVFKSIYNQTPMEYRRINQTIV